MQTNSQSGSSTKTLARIFLWLIPILVIWTILVLFVPITLSDGLYRFSVNTKTQQATLLEVKQLYFSSNEMHEWSQTHTFDVPTSKLTLDDSKTPLWNRARQQGGDLIAFEKFEDRWKVKTIDHKNGATKDSVTIDFPVEPNIIGNRFVVGMDQDNIYVHDLRKSDDSSTNVKTSFETLPNVSDCLTNVPMPIASPDEHASEEENRFYRINRLAPGSAKANAQSQNIELFEIDDQGTPFLNQHGQHCQTPRIPA